MNGFYVLVAIAIAIISALSYWAGLTYAPRTARRERDARDLFERRFAAALPGMTAKFALLDWVESNRASIQTRLSPYSTPMDRVSAQAQLDKLSMRVGYLEAKQKGKSK